MITEREFHSIYSHLYLPLGMYALRLLGSAEDAEDVVQESFLRVWQMLGENTSDNSSPSPGNLKAYLYRMVHNGCISAIRNRRESVDIDSLQQPGNEPALTEEAIDTSQRDARVWNAIDSLPDKCREIFLAAKRDGLSLKEIADDMDISLKTVKNQMTKANARLREALSDGHRPFFLPFL